MYLLLFFTCSVYFRHYFSFYRLCHLASWYQSPSSSAKSGWAAVSRKAFLLCLAQEKCTHGATTMRASLETGPQMPSRGRGWSQRCRARKSTGWPVALLTPSPGPPASPPTLGNCLHRYCTDLSRFTCSSRWQQHFASRNIIKANWQIDKCLSCCQSDCLCGVFRFLWSTTTCRRSPSWP